MGGFALLHNLIQSLAWRLISWLDSCTSSIKQYIKTSTILISNNMANEVSILLSTIYSAPKGTRLYYNILVNDNCTPSCCLKWSLFWQQRTDNISGYYRFRMYTHVTCSQSLNVQGKYLSMKYFSNSLSIWMYLFVYYVCITCTCIFVYVCYPLLERVCWHVLQLCYIVILN